MLSFDFMSVVWKTESQAILEHGMVSHGMMSRSLVPVLSGGVIFPSTRLGLAVMTINIISLI